MNDVRWGIQRYLLPTYRASCIPAPDNDVAYRYEYPPSVKEATPRAWFWRLMNHVRSGPYVKKFRAAEYMKMEDLL